VRASGGGACGRATRGQILCHLWQRAGHQAYDFPVLASYLSWLLPEQESFISFNEQNISSAHPLLRLVPPWMPWGALIHSVENCMGCAGLILLNFYHQDGVGKVYELITECKQLFKHHFADLIIAIPFWHAHWFASTRTETANSRVSHCHLIVLMGLDATDPWDQVPSSPDAWFDSHDSIHKSM
jgi:hypothetical protein